MRSGWEIRAHAAPPLRRKDYDVANRPMDGDAPKDFIRVYAYGEARRDARREARRKELLSEALQTGSAP